MVVFCAGFKGAFALDDAYCAGRIVAGARRRAHRRGGRGRRCVARSFPTALDGLNARTYGPPGLEADIEFCARENVLDDGAAVRADGRPGRRDRRLTRSGRGLEG